MTDHIDAQQVYIDDEGYVFADGVKLPLRMLCGRIWFLVQRGARNARGARQVVVTHEQIDGLFNRNQLLPNRADIDISSRTP